MGLGRASHSVHSQAIIYLENPKTGPFLYFLHTTETKPLIKAK